MIIYSMVSQIKESFFNSVRSCGSTPMRLVALELPLSTHRMTAELTVGQKLVKPTTGLEPTGAEPTTCETLRPIHLATAPLHAV